MNKRRVVAFGPRVESLERLELLSADLIPFDILPATGTVQTSPNSTTTSGPLYSVYDVPNHLIRTVQTVTTTTLIGGFNPHTVTNTVTNYGTISLGNAGDNNIPMTVIPGGSPTISGNTVTTYGPIFSIYSTSLHTIMYAQNVTTTTLQGGFNPTQTTSTVTNYGAISLGDAGHDNIPMTVLPGATLPAAGNTMTTYGPLYSVYDATAHTVMYAQNVTTTTLQGGFNPKPVSSTVTNYGGFSLGDSGHNNIPMTVLAAGNGVVYSIYDATAHTVMYAGRINPFGPSATTFYNAFSLGYSGHNNIPMNIVPNGDGLLYSIYDADLHTVMYGLRTNLFGPFPSTVYGSFSLGNAGHTNIPMTVVSSGNGPIYSIYDVNLHTVMYGVRGGITTAPSTLYGAFSLGDAGHDNIPMTVLQGGAGPIYNILDANLYTVLTADRQNLTTSPSTIYGAVPLKK